MTASAPEAHAAAAEPAPGLYRGAAEDYLRFRVPYPEQALRWIAQEHGLDGRGRLLDLGCGPGLVCLPLSLWFSEVLALDPEPEMLAVAEREARRQGLTHVRFLPLRAEDAPDTVAPLRLVTCGASFHWMDRPRVAERVWRWLEPGGGFVILAPAGMLGGSEPWRLAAVEVLQHWVGDNWHPGPGTYDLEPLHEEVLARSPFGPPKVRYFAQQHEWSVEGLIGYLHSTSFASRAVLGERAEGFARELRERLLALEPANRFSELLTTTLISARKP